MNRHTPIFKIQNREQFESQESITSVASIGIDAGEVTLSHGPDQCLKSVLRDRLPLLLHSLEQDAEIWWRRMIRSDPSPQGIPKVLDWVKIGRTGGPVHPDNLLLLQKVVDDPSSMRTCVVVLQYGTWSPGLKGWYVYATQNVIHVRAASEAAFDTV